VKRDTKICKMINTFITLPKDVKNNKTDGTSDNLAIEAVSPKPPREQLMRTICLNH